jgi:hypothetical protein
MTERMYPTTTREIVARQRQLDAEISEAFGNFNRSRGAYVPATPALHVMGEKAAIPT